MPENKGPYPVKQDQSPYGRKGINGAYPGGGKKKPVKGASARSGAGET